MGIDTKCHDCGTFVPTGTIYGGTERYLCPVCKVNELEAELKEMTDNRNFLLAERDTARKERNQFRIEAETAWGLVRAGIDAIKERDFWIDQFNADNVRLRKQLKKLKKDQARPT